MNRVLRQMTLLSLATLLVACAAPAAETPYRSGPSTSYTLRAVQPAGFAPYVAR